jgi:hypothetical protein
MSNAASAEMHISRGIVEKGNREPEALPVQLTLAAAHQVSSDLLVLCSSSSRASYPW